MAGLPVLTATKAIQALRKAGFVEARQSGSHLFLKHPDRPGRYVCIPRHPGDLHRGVLKSILAQAGLTVEQFQDLL